MYYHNIFWIFDIIKQHCTISAHQMIKLSVDEVDSSMNGWNDSQTSIKKLFSY